MRVVVGRHFVRAHKQRRERVYRIVAKRLLTVQNAVDVKLHPLVFLIERDRDILPVSLCDRIIAEHVRSIDICMILSRRSQGQQ